MTVTNAFGMVIDVPQTFQLEAGESGELCGNFGTASMAYSGPPNKGARGNAEDIDIMADDLATRFNAGPVNEQGSTIPEMYSYLTGATINNQRAVHFQLIPSDAHSITLAVRAGYPVLVTAQELNVQDTKTGQHPPYPSGWDWNANHVLPVAGIDTNGDFISPDYLNNTSTWPPHYASAILNPSWACCIQIVGPDANNPWLAPIPNGDPSSWPQGFNAQLFAAPALPPDVVLSIPDIVKYATAAGFHGDSLITCVAIALAESEGHTRAYNPETAANTPTGSGSRGLWQIYGKAHPQYNTDAVYDPTANARAAFQISTSGSNYSPWSTFGDGSYLKHVDAVKTYVIPAWESIMHTVWLASVARDHIDSGMYNKVKALYLKHNMLPPLTVEIDTTDWEYHADLVQYLNGGHRLELDNGVYTLYDETGNARIL